MPNISFTGNLKKFLAVSAAIMALIVVFLFISRGVTLDIQFKGGSIVTYSYDGNLDMNAFQDAVNDVIGVRASFQESENLATGQKTVVVSLPGSQNLTSDEMAALSQKVQDGFPENNIQTFEISNVDPLMGREFLMKCLVAVALASVLMMFYVAFRFRKIGGLSAGAMAVVALIHDILVVFGVFVIFRIPINDNFIAVLLTILGYSLNDTIVIYDRIRENEKIRGKDMPLDQLVNLSINQSFKRSLITSITSMVAMVIVSVVAVIYDVNSIISFSFPLIIGLVSGSYSSICLAGPLWVKWQERKAAKAAAGA